MTVQIQAGSGVQPLTREEKQREYATRWRLSSKGRVTEARRLSFQGQVIRLSVNPRTGICKGCGTRATTKQHHLHHTQYDPNNPARHIVELCATCHIKQHPRPAKGWTHGRRSTYTTGGCRCGLCRLAHAEYMREYQRQRRGNDGVCLVQASD